MQNWIPRSFSIFEPFITCFSSKFAKVLIQVWSSKNFGGKHWKVYQNTEFLADFKSVKKFQKMHQKNYKQTNLTNMNKSGTSAYITFLKTFFTIFLTDLKSAWNLEEMLFAHISTLSKILGQMRRKRVKNDKNVFKNVFYRKYEANQWVREPSC